MNELLDRQERKARKDHRCDLCGWVIHKGELYDWSKSIYDGTIYEWHAHKKCGAVSKEIWDYVDPDEGMSEEDFHEGCRDICEEFICPTCPIFDAVLYECDDDMPFCIDRMYEFFKTHELYRAGRTDCGGEIWKCRERS